MISSKIQNVEEKINFSQEEEKILSYWNEIKAFEKQLELTKTGPKYTFYDGPPFATGLPHYGHITAGTLKDVVTRYWSQNGYHVPRVFGWDCHGLPVEAKVNEKLKIDTKKELLDFGIANYNDECRKIVMTYQNEWETYVTRFGRWIDFKKSYKTMDTDFMESVWWVFKSIFDKGMVYRKCKIMPYSWKCTTVLSNFEVADSYQEAKDPSIVISFPLVGDENVSFLAWTTTPWTLPSNLALAVNPEFDYIKVRYTKKEIEHVVIFAECRKDDVLNKMLHAEKPEVIEKIKGRDLAGIEYVPLFDNFSYNRERGCFRVQTANWVTSENGTGIVHCAPAFGADDYDLCVANKMVDPENPLCPINESGEFTDAFPLTAGLNFKVADPVILSELKKKGRLLFSGTYIHPYPFCWRTDTPLMYKAIPSWFIAVESIRDQLVENNQKARWVPKNIQDKRFHNWLASARDWCFSRNRSWGNPIPIWVSDDFEEVVCVGSIKELQELSGCGEITDLHREFIDNITIPSKQGKGQLHRIEEVFDCWFESGSMPYAQIKYPFSMSEEKFKEQFPADFIAEGIDQTRGWFYTLNVISTILFDSNPYKNLIVNGLVLAADGKKLSKKLGNFTDPKEVLEQFGADAVRLYLMNSPLVKGENLRFKDEGLASVIKDIFLPLYNSYRFLVQNVKRYEEKHGEFIYNHDKIFNDFNSLNITDKWIIAYGQRLIKFVRNEMENYRLYTVVEELLSFLEKLTNWYIRLNRPRLRGEQGQEESAMSLNILSSVLIELVILLSPFVPFISETIYLNLRHGYPVGHPMNVESIHFLHIPEAKEYLIDSNIEKVINNMINVIEQGRLLRELVDKPIKMPIRELQVINYDQQFLDDIKQVENYVIDELNINSVTYINNEEDYLSLQVLPNLDLIFGKAQDVKSLLKDPECANREELENELEGLQKLSAIKIAAINALTPEEIREIIKNGHITVNDVHVEQEEIIVHKYFNDKFIEEDKTKKPVKKVKPAKGEKKTKGKPENKETPVVEEKKEKKEREKKVKTFEIDEETVAKYVALSNPRCGIRLNTNIDEELMNFYYARLFNNKAQTLRKNAGVVPTDDLIVYADLSGSEEFQKGCSANKDFIAKVLKKPFVMNKEEIPNNYTLIKESQEDAGNEKTIVISLYKA